MIAALNPENIFAEGVLLEGEENGVSRVQMPNGHELIAFLPGKMRESRIPLLPGEKVLLEISPYDLSRGRIIVDTAKSVDPKATEAASVTRVAEAKQRASTGPAVASGEEIPSGGFVVP